MSMDATVREAVASPGSEAPAWCVLDIVKKRLTLSITIATVAGLALAIDVTAFEEHGAEAVLVISGALIVQVQAAAQYVEVADRVLGSATDPAIGLLSRMRTDEVSS